MALRHKRVIHKINKKFWISFKFWLGKKIFDFKTIHVFSWSVQFNMVIKQYKVSSNNITSTNTFKMHNTIHSLTPIELSQVASVLSTPNPGSLTNRCPHYNGRRKKRVLCKYGTRLVNLIVRGCHLLHRLWLGYKWLFSGNTLMGSENIIELYIRTRGRTGLYTRSGIDLIANTNAQAQTVEWGALWDRYGSNFDTSKTTMHLIPSFTRTPRYLR